MSTNSQQIHMYNCTANVTLLMDDLPIRIHAGLAIKKAVVRRSVERGPPNTLKNSCFNKYNIKVDDCLSVSYCQGANGNVYDCVECSYLGHDCLPENAQCDYRSRNCGNGLSCGNKFNSHTLPQRYCFP